MNSRVAFPFLCLSDDAVRFEGWMIGDPGQALHPADSILENWDYARDLEIAASLTIDWGAASGELQLPAEQLKLRLSLIAGTGTGNLPRRQERLREIVVDHSSGETHLSGIVSGRNLSGRLKLSLHASLEAPIDSGSVLSPKSHAARLWQCRHDILIEDGGDSRFPVETASFSEAFQGRPQEHAPWYLHWRPGTLQADFSACARLYINSDRPEIIARFAGGDRPTLQAIMGDVMSQMVEYALEQEDISDVLAECEEGSVGRQIRQWLDIGFPGQPIASIKAMWDQSPGTFRAAVLAASEIGGADQ